MSLLNPNIYYVGLCNLLVVSIRCWLSTYITKLLLAFCVSSTGAVTIFTYKVLRFIKNVLPISDLVTLSLISGSTEV